MLYNINGTPLTTQTPCFDTVAALKASTDLKAGDVAMTLGYYTKGDGGGGSYFLKTPDGTTLNGYTQFSVNGLTAELVDDGREINVLQWGMNPDGATDNLPIFNAIIAAFPMRTIYFPKGTYAFAGSLTMDFCYMILDNAELLCTGKYVLHFVNILGKMYPPERPHDGMFIRGNGTINGNFNANNCITLARHKHTTIDGIHIKNFISNGIHGKNWDTSLEPNLSYELVVSNCLISNELSCSSATGIQDRGDSTYTNIIILNVKTAIEASGGSIFHNIHAWCYDFDNSSNRKELLQDTIFAKLRSTNCRFSDCYIDTYHKGFVPIAANMTAFVLNLKWYINGETWPSDLQGVVFCADSNGNAKYKVLGAEVPGNYNTKFSDIDISKTSSEFYGVISNAENAPNS